MRNNNTKRLLTFALAAVLTLAQPLSAVAAGTSEKWGGTSAAIETGGASEDSLNPAGDSRANEESLETVDDKPVVLDEEPVEHWQKIKNPTTTAKVSTWDCVWFGRYWQDDTNGDGYCFSKETPVGDVPYPADDQKPIKWRVLSVNKLTGEALLLSDKLLDVVPYYENEVNNVGVTWEESTLRSFLNSYDDSKNKKEIDYSSEGFYFHAFNENEKAAIIEGTVINDDNPKYPISGGNDTNDKLFCLSLSEVVNPDYGFWGTNYDSNSDATRKALFTGYASQMNGDSGVPAGTGFSWWLRSPGNSTTIAAYVTQGGYTVYAGTGAIARLGVRPALRLNLKDNPTLWSYAGQASSQWKYDSSLIANPFTYTDPDTKKSVTTWHCVYFGNYWQDTNSNGDDKVNEEDTQDPIKWRVLEIDKYGNALLMADKLLDAQQFNGSNAETTTWENCSLRSYLNSEGNYASNGFLIRAFDQAERKAISVQDLKNEKNPVYSEGYYDDIKDQRIFLLSVSEATKEEYGFVANEFVNGYSGDDPTRVALNSRFALEKHGSGTTGTAQNWWLRTMAGTNGYHACEVKSTGSVVAQANSYNNSTTFKKYVRPALRINLKNNVNLWTYAGKVISQTGEADLSKIDKPRTYSGVTTWDCIYFGDYWQETDLNGDDKVTDTDPRDPIRWRVLDIDKESGEVLLLSDRLLEEEYYNYNSNADVIWETSTLRSYLNGYGKESNLSQRDYANENASFKLQAFSQEERDAIKESSIENNENPIYHTGGGNNTEDKVFCLSIEEARNSDYGFIKNEFTKDSGMPQAVAKDMTDDDNTRVAERTKYMIDKSGSGSRSWWLRTPGPNRTNQKYQLYGSEVTELNYSYGKVNAYGAGASSPDPVRPALRLNLKEHPGLWVYAGKVSSDKVPVETVTLPAEKMVLSVNDLVDIEAAIEPENAENKEVTWESDHPEYVTVTQSEENGLIATIKGVKKGTATITVKSVENEEKYATMEVEVKQQVTGVSLEEKTLDLIIGDVVTLTPKVLPEDANEKGVTWNSSDESVASVDDEGTVTAKKEGETTVTVTTKDGGFTADALITVKKGFVHVTRVTLSSQAVVGEHQMIKLVPEIEPANADDKSVTWSSSDTKIASVDENGVVTGNKKGKCVITVKTNDGGLTSTCAVEVKELILIPGEVRRLSLSGNQFFYNVRWTVTYKDPKVKCVTVKNGIVTAKNLKKGVTSADAVVTATCGSIVKEYNITVNGEVKDESGNVIDPKGVQYLDGKKKVKLTAPKTLKLNVGDKKVKYASVGIPAQLRDQSKYTLSCSILTGNVCEIDGNTLGSFKVSNAKPNKNGSKASVEVTPKNAGASYVIWSMTDEKGNTTKAVTKVMVKKPVDSLSVASLSSNADTLTLDVGEGERLSVFTTPDNTDPKDVSFSVKGKGVKVSKSGCVVATMPEGDATVTVKCGKAKPATVKVKVNKHEGDYLTLKKTFMNAKAPKDGKDDKAVSVAIATPKKQKGQEQPKLNLSLDGKPTGLTVGTDKKGNPCINVSSKANPGCYWITATAATGSYNETGFELIVK